MTVDIKQVKRLEDRNKQLIKSINIINSYEPYLRLKYYNILTHNIALLAQYTIIINEYYEGDY